MAGISATQKPPTHDELEQMHELYLGAGGARERGKTTQAQHRAGGCCRMQELSSALSACHGVPPLLMLSERCTNGHTFYWTGTRSLLN